MIRQLIGNAVSGERLFNATLQDFDSGLIFSTDQGTSYILDHESNGWERAE